MDSNIEETGTPMKMKPPGGVRTVRTPDNIEAVRAAVIRGPHCCVCRR